MKILIIGGTRFVGRAIAESALTRGHEVTLFHRGKTGGELFTQAEHIFGDREHDLAALNGRSWDIVIDTCAYTPRITRLAAEALVDAAPRYLFISTISVYANFNGRITEESPLATLPDPTVEEVTGETYGALKVLCESVVSEIYGSRATILRPGLIAGPHDPTDRFTYWVERIARGGETLAPRISGRPIEFIDARDLAEFTITACENNTTGIYNAVGFDPPLSIEDFLTACCAELSGHCQLIWVDEDFLVANDIAFWTDLPICLPPDDDHRGYRGTDASRAIARGLTLRPLRETIRDTYTWSRSRPEGYKLKTGLDPERERAALDKWRTLQQEGQ